MDALLARYLDGDLSEDEARSFLERLEREPRLAEELREYEQILSTARSLPRTETSSGFTDGVMQRIVQESLLSKATASSRSASAGREHGTRSWFTWRSWQGAIAMAAVLVAVLRLVYVPQSDDLQSVSVAGSFNGWNTRNLPLKKEGTVWTTTLVLPPGSYEYMFVENGKRWVTDPLAPHTRDDGFGNRNAVLDLGA